LPGYVDRTLRRPLDESMLVRLVVVGGLISGTEVAKFYAQQPGLRGTQSLEQYLLDKGVDPQRLDAIKRAYAETDTVGALLLRFLAQQGADETKLRAARRALNACETAQLMAIKKGKAAKPIGEMMIELGHVSADDLTRIVSKQGMLRKVEQYTEQARVESTLAGKLGLHKPGRKIKLSVGLAAVVFAGLGLVVLLNLWTGGAFDTEVRWEEQVFGGEFNAANTTSHIRMITQHYANMMTELRRRSPRNAKHYRKMLDAYFKQLETAKISIDDPEIQHIRRTYSQLDFSALEKIPVAQLPRLSNSELEAKLKK
jgi:hypothetical protein